MILYIDEKNVVSTGDSYSKYCAEIRMSVYASNDVHLFYKLLNRLLR